MNRHKVELKVDGIKIVGEVYLPRSGGPHPGLVLCHGIPSGNHKNPDDGGYPALAERFVDEGFVVMIFNFRGAGLSEGHFDIMGWTRDLNAGLDFFCAYDSVDKERISVMAFSGGAMVAVYAVARDERVKALVSCCCPVRIRQLRRTRTSSATGRLTPSAPEPRTRPISNATRGRKTSWSCRGWLLTVR